MKAKVVVFVVLLALVAVGAVAGEKAKSKDMTLSGKLACAKCTLKTEDAHECQSVLVVEGKKEGDAKYYYVVDNDVTEEFGHACQGMKDVVVTGSVEKKDGKMWLTASKMSPPQGA